MENILEKVKGFVKKLSIHHYIVFACVAAIGIFNAVTGLSPIISQKELESNIEKSFEKWWEEEGAAQFRTVGLSDDEKTKLQEFVQYRDRIVSAGTSFDIEEHTKGMRKEFREWWEIGGGKDQYTQEHKKYPGEKEFERECHKYIKNYTDRFARYRLAYVPKDGDYDRLLSSWILFPGVAGFFIFAGFFLLSYVRLSDRWGALITLGCFLLLAIGGGLICGLFTETSFFSHSESERYMGASIALAFMLGACAFDSKKDSVPSIIRGLAVAGFMADVLVNILVYSHIFVAIAVASVPAFALGAFAGIKIPHRRKSIQEIRSNNLERRMQETAQRNITAERRKKTREKIDEGFSEAQKGHYDSARICLSQAMTSLLQEQPLDSETLKKFSERMVSPNLFIDVASTQWLEWGEAARSRRCYPAALYLLEKGLTLEKDPRIARRALFTVGEMRINSGIEPKEGIKRLEKVLEMDAGDLLAKQAQKLLDKTRPSDG